MGVILIYDNYIFVLFEKIDEYLDYNNWVNISKNCCEGDVIWEYFIKR